MKKFSLIAIIMLAVSFTAGAQGMEDALRYSQQYYVGSARTMAMGNAFTALGGDLGAIGINPASTAIYNCCEFAITGGLTWNNTTSLLEASEDNYTTRTTRTKFTLPNISAVFSLPTGREYGLVSYSFGFGYNKTNDFNSRVSFGGLDGVSSLLGNIAAGLEGFDNSNLLAVNAFANDNTYCTPQEVLAWNAYLVNPYNGFGDSYIGANENQWEGGLGVDNPLYKSYDLITGGGAYDIAFNFGMNFSDRLYLGANLNVKVIDFEKSLWYSEKAQDGDWFDSGFKSMDYNFWQRTSGSGINLQLGAIYVPFDFLRLGISYTTPTLYTLTDRWDEYIASKFDGSVPDYKDSEIYFSDLYAEETETQSTDFFYEYDLRAPSRLSLGAAFVFGRAGLLSADVETVNYGKMRLSETDRYSDYFDGTNADIAKYCPRGTIVRVGGEMNAIGDISLRAGYTGYFYNQPGYQFLSFGIGKRITENSSLDLGFRTSLKDKYDMLPYDDYAFNEAGEAQCTAPLAKISSRFNTLLLTYRVKF